jgi:hypothetical protein
VRFPGSPWACRCQSQQRQKISLILSWSYSIVNLPVRSYARLVLRQTALPGGSSLPLAWLNPNPIIDRRPDALSRSQILLRCLDRYVAEQKLDLIQFTARIPT